MRSRHGSHNILREKLPRLEYRGGIRLGSTTEIPSDVIMLNSIEGVKNSSNKLLMKQCFIKVGVSTAVAYKICIDDEETYFINLDDNEDKRLNSVSYPIVAKHHYGSRGQGNYLLKTVDELHSWMSNKSSERLNNYLFEEFVNYALEFRLHVTKHGCFYACRKALKLDTPKEEKWHFHSDTCVWYLETNEKFLKPNSWDDIIEDCKKALESIGADILAFDVKVQSSSDKKGNPREYQKFIIIESNSAPSLNEYGAQEYIKIIPELINEKYSEKQNTKAL